MLIPARLLVNGATITREHPPRITWLHVELADPTGAPVHDIVLAEGLPTESYLDTGNRDAFANGGPALNLHPDFGRDIWARKSHAPLILEGAEIEALRSWLLACAETLGHRRTTNPNLRITCDGVPLIPIVDGLWHRMTLPAGAHHITITSQTAIPAEVLETSNDPRPLGIGLASWSLDHQPHTLDDPSLATGWHPAETTIRWTAGNATINVQNTTHISLALHPVPAYWATTPTDQPNPARAAIR